jgi:hypothetical protein
VFVPDRALRLSPIKGTTSAGPDASRRSRDPSCALSQGESLLPCRRRGLGSAARHVGRRTDGRFQRTKMRPVRCVGNVELLLIQAYGGLSFDAIAIVRKGIVERSASSETNKQE